MKDPNNYYGILKMVQADCLILVQVHIASALGFSFCWTILSIERTIAFSTRRNLYNLDRYNYLYRYKFLRVSNEERGRCDPP